MIETDGSGNEYKSRVEGEEKTAKNKRLRSKEGRERQTKVGGKQRKIETDG